MLCGGHSGRDTRTHTHRDIHKKCTLSQRSSSSFSSAPASSSSLPSSSLSASRRPCNKSFVNRYTTHTERQCLSGHPLPNARKTNTGRKHVNSDGQAGALPSRGQLAWSRRRCLGTEKCRAINDTDKQHVALDNICMCLLSLRLRGFSTSRFRLPEMFRKTFRRPQNLIT